MRTLLIIVVVSTMGAAQAQSFNSNRPPAPPTPVPSVAVASPTGRRDRDRDAVCAERNARYPIPGQCDGYLECHNWRAEEMMCPEGLRFRPEAHFIEFPCGYPIDVTCKDRAALQPPKQTQECPHQFGYFRTGDSKNCGVYRNCVNGKGFDFHCPEGLAYNSATYRCEWPDLVADCDAEAFVGFRCPARAFGEDDQPLFTGNAFYRHERECRKYYACVDGKPRLLSCEAGKAFDEFTAQCEDIDTVSGCRA